MKKTILPTISVVIATYNSERTLELCLRKVREQDYPRSKVEIIIADGGSTDQTLGIAKKFLAKMVRVDPYHQNAEYNKGIGVRAAGNDIVLLLDYDNILPHRQWFAHMVKPFMDHPEVVDVEPLRFHYDPTMTPLDRYCALLGGSDPGVYYLGKDSHLSWMENSYTLLGHAQDRGNYYLVTYTRDGIPALGGNGAAIRRKLLLEHAQADPEHFYHIDVLADLIRKGFTTFALTKDTIMHLTNNRVIPFLLRRKYFIDRYQFDTSLNRRYFIYDPSRDKLRLMWYTIISLTVVVPLYDALRGFIKVHDWVWFLHPFMCLAYLFLYGTSVIQGAIRRVFTNPG